MAEYHLAQVNIARMRDTLNGPAMAGLVKRIGEMNQLAEGSEGFVWRFKGEATPETLSVFKGYFEPFEPEKLFYNLSVWRSVDDLQNYVFRTTHAEMFRGKAGWMDAFDRAHLALWWIPAGHAPTIAESAERLRAVDARGPTPFAFSFRNSFPKPHLG